MRWLLVITCGCSFQVPPGSSTVDPDASIPPPSGGFSKQIVILPTGVGSDLAGFPLLFVEASDPALVMRARSDGADIAFLDANGVRAPHELASFVASNGALTAWVRVPMLATGAPTMLTMTYGSPTPEPSTSTAVWDTDYEGVYHFDETAVGAVHDSTAHARDGMMVAAPMVAVPGEIGTAFRFAGGNSFVTMGSQMPFTGTQPWTLSVWARATSANPANVYARIVVQRSYMPTVDGFGLERHGVTGAANCQRDIAGNSRGGSDPLNLTTGSFRSLGVVYDGAQITMFAGGAIVGMQADARAMPVMPPTVFKVGADTNTSGGASDQFAGDVDEVRVSSRARSPAWFAEEQANQSNPTASYIVGAEVQRPP